MQQLGMDYDRRFDKVASAKARDRGLAHVERGSGTWQVEALAAIRLVALRKEFLTTDDIWREMGQDPEVEGRAMGAAMRTAARFDLVKKTDRTIKSVRVACHRRDVRVWQSRIYGTF